MEKLLEVKDLSVCYGTEQVLKNMDLEVYSGEIICIVGESGSGKTTFIHTIANMLSEAATVHSGSIHYGSCNLLRLSEKKWCTLYGAEISMIFQNPAAYFNPIKRIGSQLIEVIVHHRKITKKEARKKAVAALSKMNFSDVEKVMTAYPFQLSGGMIQRVAIAMAYVLEPKLILADEPTSALDVISQKLIVDELMALRDSIGTSIIMVTHNIGCAAYIADKIKVMQCGQVVEYEHRCKIVKKPAHDYTKKLFEAVPKLHRKNKSEENYCYKKKTLCIGCHL